MKKFKLVRLKFSPSATAGEIRIDGKFFCYTVEDPVRDIKIWGQTAIPYGIYPLVVTYSPKFKRQLTLIDQVPNFSGIRMHNGTTAGGSAGCPLLSFEKKSDFVLVNSWDAANEFQEIVEAESKKGKCEIEVCTESAFNKYGLLLLLVLLIMAKK